MGFSAIISQYGMIDMEHEHLSQAYHKDMNGSPQMPIGTVDDYGRSLKPDAIRSTLR